MVSGKLCGKLAIAMIPLAAAVVLVGSSNPMVVRMQGPCDPASFNAAVGPGTCIGNGTITFAHFITELTNAQKAGSLAFRSVGRKSRTGNGPGFGEPSRRDTHLHKGQRVWRRVHSIPQHAVWYSRASAGMRHHCDGYANTE